MDATAILRQVESSWRIPDCAEKWSMCAHEVGHAFISRWPAGRVRCCHRNSLGSAAVTVIPSAGTLGESDQLTTSKDRLFGTIQSLFGGRIAEELWVGETKSQRPVHLAYFAAAKCDFDDQLGLITIPEGREPGPELKNKIDAAVQRILKQCKTDARELLFSIEEKWREFVKKLYEKEQLQVQKVLDFVSQLR
ncbi:hypothetical protein niasHT_016236 [Heterodera trifolii]|uniref:Peptidase M41 domain-containing protein n=1 Tax=Heterodera trifolii TaxID=157864 RepID=A0ABD2LIV9_9BILA